MALQSFICSNALNELNSESTLFFKDFKINELRIEMSRLYWGYFKKRGGMMGAIPIVFEVDGEEICTEADLNEKLWEVLTRVILSEIVEWSTVVTFSGYSMDRERP